MDDPELHGRTVLALPLAIAPLSGKYYGTQVIDATGASVIDFWEDYGKPSARELAMWKSFDDFTENHDLHWESEISLALAEMFVKMANTAMTSKYRMQGNHKCCNRGNFSLADIDIETLRLIAEA